MKVLLVVFGAIIVIGSIFRHLTRRRPIGEAYQQHIDSIKLPPYTESNDFGQKVKWIVENNEPEGLGPGKGPEPPADKGSNP